MRMVIMIDEEEEDEACTHRHRGRNWFLHFTELWHPFQQSREVTLFYFFKTEIRSKRESLPSLQQIARECRRDSVVRLADNLSTFSPSFWGMLSRNDCRVIAKMYISIYLLVIVKIILLSNESLKSISPLSRNMDLSLLKHRTNYYIDYVKSLNMGGFRFISDVISKKSITR